MLIFSVVNSGGRLKSDSGIEIAQCNLLVYVIFINLIFYVSVCIISFKGRVTLILERYLVLRSRFMINRSKLNVPT